MSKKLFPLKTFQQDAILKRLSELSEIVPQPEESDAGKVVKVNEDGNYELGEASSGTKLYRHFLKVSSSSEWGLTFISTRSSRYPNQSDGGSWGEILANENVLIFANDSNLSLNRCFNIAYISADSSIHFYYRISSENYSHLTYGRSLLISDTLYSVTEL